MGKSLDSSKVTLCSEAISLKFTRHDEDCVRCILNFLYVFLVEAVGRSGVLILLWDESVEVILGLLKQLH